ncbi:MAG: DEAD/DEAH box helicase [Treponema sp.]|jgi:ATP-dependent RNA helicase DeaD|nr:DEAD/DEAH box helicase [Treponema sp.]
MTTDCHPFASFGLSDTILDALTQKGFTAPSSIQTLALPRLLADTGHLIVKARTGTGKTAAFGIPLVERLTQGGHAPRALILTPTRELALQIAKEIASLTTGPFPRITAVYGGSSIRNQILDLKRGTEIVVGTPGRIMDLMERKVLDLSAVDWCILDEADEMLDMGFFEDVETILKAVKSERRVALFSATMPEGILRIVRDYIGEVEILEDSAPEDEKPAVDQYYLVVKKEDRLEALRRVIDGSDDFYGLIFCATKAGTDELARRLVEGDYAAEAIHGDLSQEARERTLRRFRSRITTILVATDVAARGLDIERLTHVINWDLPNDRETYVHRIGRTGRAGRRGKAISLVLPAERGRISHLSRNMERTLGTKIEWMKVPKIKLVMNAIKRRILLSVTAALPTDWSPHEEAALPLIPDPENPGEALSPVPPLHAQVSRELIEKLGGEGAVEALIALTFGDLLDPSRYGSITEFQETSPRDEGRGRPGTRRSARRDFDGSDLRVDHWKERHFSRGGASKGDFALSPGSGFTRVYVELGRRHGASARDVAKLLMQAGGIPGRLVDGIEIKDYCAFATLPEDAALRACTFSRKNPDNPTIKPAVARR